MPKLTRTAKKKVETSNQQAKNLVKEYFKDKWLFYKEKHGTDGKTSEKLCEHFFYLGARLALNAHKNKDYAKQRKEHEKEIIKGMKLKREINELKREIFKIKREKDLTLDETAKLFQKFAKKNKERPDIAEELDNMRKELLKHR